MAPAVIAFGPGRVNLIGEHTDYNEGLSLAFAIEDGVTVRGEGLTEPRIEAIALDLAESDAFELGDGGRADGWRTYVRGAVGELQRHGVAVPGARLEISGTVPPGSGLASSAALETALVLALLALAGEPEGDRRELARLCSRIENEWVGAHTGLLDQLSSLCGEAGCALLIDFRSLEVDTVALELRGHRLVTIDSGEPHVNAESGYNERRSECARACELLGLESLRDATVGMAARLPSPLGMRVRHVIGANERVVRTVAALERGDLVEVGKLLDEAHASLRDLYEVSTDRVERAVGRLKDAGALGVRMIGGGFGGHVLGLLAPQTALPAGALEVRPCAGARVLEGD